MREQPPPPAERSTDSAEAPSSNTEICQDRGVIEVPSSTFDELLSKFRTLDHDSQIKLQRMREAMQSRRQNASREVAALVASMVSHNDNVSQMRFTCGLETIVEEHRKKMEDVERKLEEEKLHRLAREEEIHALNTRIAELGSENAQLIRDDGRRASSGSIDAGSVVATTIEEIKQDRQIMESQIARIAQRADALEGEKERWLLEREQLEKRADELSEENEKTGETRNENGVLRRTLAEAEERAEDLLSRVAELQAEKRELLRENEDLRHQLDRLVSGLTSIVGFKEGVSCARCEESMMRLEDLLSVAHQRGLEALSLNQSPPPMGILECPGASLGSGPSSSQQNESEIDAVVAERNALAELSSRLEDQLSAASHGDSVPCSGPRNHEEDTSGRDAKVSCLEERMLTLERENEELRAACHSQESTVERLKLDLVDARDLSASLNNQLLCFGRSSSSTVGSGTPLSQGESSPCRMPQPRSHTFIENDVQNEATPLTPHRQRRRRSSSGGIYGLLARATGNTPSRDSASKQIQDLQRIAQELTMHVEEKEETIFHLRRLLSEHKDFLVSETSPNHAAMQPPSDCPDTI
ncbi:hypothetical protein FOZ61_005885 [Perkinsus olseni]|uniref:Uncharacterized protein n=1 Tax=Perkinsus olseni TaxID=32597 RepID=A0A7J6LFJ9_PEROL|nr:hypothetical protein FOZ61_005885 [Perkinsus olseni]KAF4676438.1 hypothetical protein FOL46_002944 [Perkinsus olseni]